MGAVPQPEKRRHGPGRRGRRIDGAVSLAGVRRVATIDRRCATGGRRGTRRRGNPRLEHEPVHGDRLERSDHGKAGEECREVSAAKPGGPSSKLDRGECVVRRVWRIAAWIGAGVASGGALLRGQTNSDPPKPLPAQPPTGAKLYYPAYSPMPGAPAPVPAPNGNLPARSNPPQSNPIVPVSGSNPPALSRSIMTAPAIG